MAAEAEKDKKPFRILLVDDEPSVLFALKLLLEALGYKPIDFPVAADALEFLRNNGECDLFICDLKMPKMTGLEVLETAKQIRKELPFVLMSAHATGAEVDRAKELGAHGFLAKPFTPDQLHAVVREVRGG